jgi:hypothetical protein
MSTKQWRTFRSRTIGWFRCATQSGRHRQRPDRERKRVAPNGDPWSCPGLVGGRKAKRRRRKQKERADVDRCPIVSPAIRSFQDTSSLSCNCLSAQKHRAELVLGQNTNSISHIVLLSCSVPDLFLSQLQICTCAAMGVNEHRLVQHPLQFCVLYGVRSIQTLVS